MWYYNNIKVDLLPELSKDKGELLNKYVYPAIGSLLENTKAEVEQPVIKLVQVLHKLAGKNFIESVPAAQLERVMEIIKAQVT